MADYDVLLFDVLGVLAEDSDTITTAVLEATQMTNEELWGFWVQSPAVRDKFGLGGLLDAYYLSHEMGMLKPDKEAFEYVIRDLDVAPERIVFFDDLELNANSAEEAGMNAFQTRGVKELESELERLGVL